MHGFAGTRLYEVWVKMKQRTKNPNNQAYKNYGGRGVGICEEWETDFGAFHQWAVESGYKEGLSIDRIDNEKGYSPDNCRWITRKAQNRNKRSNRFLTYHGITKSMVEWAETVNIHPKVLQMRLDKGWDLGKALTRPVKHYEKKEKES